MEEISQNLDAITHNRFKVRVGVVVLDAQNRLLLARQNRRPFWVLPGGTLEQGESLGECAVREIKEEANLDIQLGDLLYVGDFFAEDGRQVIDIAFYGHLQGGTFKKEISENIDELDFFTRATATKMHLKPEKMFQAICAAWESGIWTPGHYLGNYA